MGVKGLYSCLKQYSTEVVQEDLSPLRIGLDAYPFLYKFKYDLNSCIQLFQTLKSAGHSLTIFVDGNPPKEKMEELAQRRQQREQAYKQAEALKTFLNDSEKSGSLDEEARLLIQKQIALYEVESYSIKKETREEFLRRVREEMEIPILMCEGESDDMLIQASLKKEVDVIIANDMDLFVGGVERLWMLGKTHSDPLFLEFRRDEISKTLGIHSKSWMDVAILAGYEKAPHLKRTSAQQAIVWIRYYGSLENLLSRREELLQKNTKEEFLNARKFFQV
jgi:5'-3' exonuclease